ncbi:MAG: hypothetical protein K0S54_650 [Alphaproteobacteria bacterium]|jgi:hypothetical protein|nr:hypothetical protein [Alphaproteobacteria bacterium]
MWCRTILLAALLFVLALPVAQAQTPRPLGAEDAVRAYDIAQISRSAVRDQLALCVDDGEKLEQVYTRLRPSRASDRGDWGDWGELLARVGGELKTCLRGYVKQLALHRRDLALFEDRLPLLKEPKRLTISPKLVIEINAYAAGLEKELSGYASQARTLANAAELSSGRADALLREAGVLKFELPQGFGDGI